MVGALRVLVLAVVVVTIVLLASRVEGSGSGVSVYWGTSLIRNNPPVRPYKRVMPSRELIEEQMLHGNVKWFRGGLVTKALRLLHHSTLGSRVIKKRSRSRRRRHHRPPRVEGRGFRVQGLGFRFQVEGLGSRVYRGTSLIRKFPPLGPYRRPMPRDLGGS